MHAQLSGAAKAQAAMATGPASCRPFDGAARAQLLAAWHRVHDQLADTCGWDADCRDLPASFVSGSLALAGTQSVQGIVSRAVGDRNGTEHLSKFALSPAGRRSAARIRSASGGAASAWLEARPSSHATTLDCNVFAAAGRHRLGLGPQTSLQHSQQPVCRCGAGDPAAPCHGMVCNGCKKERTIRHDLVASALRLSLANCGLASSREPRYDRLAHGCQAAVAAGSKRGDVLTTMPDGQVTVLDIVVSHPAAASYVQRASKETGATALQAEQTKHRSFEQRVGGGGYDFVPVSIESYGRLGRETARLLSKIGDVAATRGRVPKAVFVRAAHQRISCALARGNAEVYFHAGNLLVKQAGQAYLPGQRIPIGGCVD